MSILRITGECFTVTQNHREAVDGLQLEHRLARCRIRGNDGGLEGAIQYLTEHDTPQLLVIEMTETGDALFGQLESLSQVCDPGVQLILLGRENDIQLYKKLTEMGIGDYLCGDVTADNLLQSIEKMFGDADGATLGRVISFIGARGGVGSSTLAANTAYSLSQIYDEAVILMDLDVAFGSAAIAYDKQPRQNLADALAEPDRLDDVMIERFMQKYDDNFSIMAAPAILEGDSNIDHASFEIVVDLVRRLAGFVVLDVPHQWSPWVQSVLMTSDEIVVSAYPDLLNLRDIKNFFELLTSKRSVNAPNRLVLSSIGRSKKSELKAKFFEDETKVAPSVLVPYDAGLFSEALNTGQMLTQINKSSKVVKEINSLAEVVSARIQTSKGGKGKKSRFWQRNSGS